MKDNDDLPLREKQDGIAAAAIALMLFLTAWGNAIALMIGSLLGLVVIMIVFKGHLRHGAGLAAIIGIAVAIIIAIALFLGWRS